MIATALASAVLLVATWFAPAAAQFPAEPEGLTLLRSRFDNNVTISYKQTAICETTPGVRAYSGYVHLPPGSLADLGEQQDYPINTFFWFFEAKTDPSNAPLAIWINGGPGSSSMLGLFVENGPCHVNPDSNSTTPNPWSWNNEVNMLYIDQPVQVGFSYDILQNITTNLVTGDIILLNATDPIPDQNATYLIGTYPSQNVNSTSLGTHNAAIAFWHFAQAWFQEFPAYSPNDSRISLATESYGGRYGPAFTSFFEEQNQRIENGTWSNMEGEMYILHLDTLMIINGCVDRLVQWPSYPHIAYNNTYGIQAINASIHAQMLDALFMPGGCQDQIYQCRNLSTIYDPENIGINASVNSVCMAAETFCVNGVRSPYSLYSDRNYYDFGTIDPDPFPAPFYEVYLNQPHVQSALGVPLNFTSASNTVSTAFQSIGDYPRPGWLEDLAYLLENNIKVTMVYGDRDYACNWIGGEAVSLAINYTNTTQFHAAGYTALQTNSSYEGGQTRQYGNLSFSRVYESGHEVPAYQPETAYRIFQRTLFNMDIATGTVSTASNASYMTTGPPDTWAIKNKPPPQPLQFCYVQDPTATCTDDQIASVENGTAVVKNWIVVDKNSTQLFPDVVGNATDSATSSSASSMPSSASSSTPSSGSNALQKPLLWAGTAAVVALAV